MTKSPIFQPTIIFADFVFGYWLMSGWEPATLYYNIVGRYKSVTEAWILSAPSLDISRIITALPLSEV